MVTGRQDEDRQRHKESIRKRRHELLQSGGHDARNLLRVACEKWKVHCRAGGPSWYHCHTSHKLSRDSKAITNGRPSRAGCIVHLHKLTDLVTWCCFDRYICPN